MENNQFYGSYASIEEAIKEVERLERLGYTRDEISIIAKDRSKAEKITGVGLDETESEIKTVYNDDPIVKKDFYDKPIEGDGYVETREAGDSAIAGAATGAAIGGIGGLLAAAGALVIPGIGPILAAGPIAAALAGAATGGLVGGAVGGIAGALSESGIPEEDAKRLGERFNEGDIVVYTKPKDRIKTERVDPEPYK